MLIGGGNLSWKICEDRTGRGTERRGVAIARYDAVFLSFVDSDLVGGKVADSTLMYR